jgi:3-deoxy-manno-octulosonate cytidylyltransferase (CMP-KDO synthetase)
MTSTAILIPARYGSTRFEGKPLVELGGVPMIKRVYNTCKSTGIDTYVLTDDQRIYNVIGPNCYLDNEEYDNGTERCTGAVNKWDVLKEYDQFVNVQGDMPDVTEQIISRCIEWLKHYPISTVYTEMPKEMQNDPNSVKMVRAGDQALWFGRGMTGYGEWHLGVYGYKRNPLEFYDTYEVEQEEQVEKLEQLRWLKNGWQIGCSSVYFNGVEINEPKDVDKWHSKNSQ